MFFEKRDINQSKLPTKRDIIGYLLFLKHNGASNVPKIRKLYDYIPIIIKSLCQIWERAGIPIIKRTTLRRYIKCLVDKHYNILKHPNKYEEAEWNELFRISQCKCGIELNMNCSCSYLTRIPPEAKNFFIDQCGARSLSLDDGLEQTEMATGNQAENPSEYRYDIVSDMPATSLYSAGYIPNSSEDEDEEILDAAEEKLKVSDISLQNYSQALDRTDTSDRYGSLLATTLIKDLRVSILAKIKKEFSTDISARILQYFDDLIIDKNKISRERTKYRLEAEIATRSNTILQCISYDGKKDITLKKKIVHGQIRIMREREEHITIVKEPGSQFVGYTTPAEGTAEKIQESIANFLIGKNYSLNNLVALSCDGTAVNTGYKTGVNVRMERNLQRPLQWNVCLFHFNELPLRALLSHFFGEQNGPGIWQKGLGSEILACEKYPVSSDLFSNMQTFVDNYKNVYVSFRLLMVSSRFPWAICQTISPPGTFAMTSVIFLTWFLLLIEGFVMKSWPVKDLVL